MSKRKTLKKPVRSLNDMPTLKAKDKTNLLSSELQKGIRNKKYVSKALLECLAANDTVGFKEILRTHLELVNKEEFAKNAGVSKRSLFRILSKNGNPTLNNISKIIFQLSS